MKKQEYEFLKKVPSNPNEGKSQYKANECIRFSLYIVMVLITPEWI